MIIQVLRGLHGLLKIHVHQRVDQLLGNGRTFAECHRHFQRRPCSRVNLLQQSHAVLDVRDLELPVRQ